MSFVTFLYLEIFNFGDLASTPAVDTYSNETAAWPQIARYTLEPIPLTFRTGDPNNAATAPVSTPAGSGSSQGWPVHLATLLLLLAIIPQDLLCRKPCQPVLACSLTG